MFIELTDSQSKEKVALKIDGICRMLYVGEHTIVSTIDGKETQVSESYDAILKALERKQSLRTLASIIHPNT